MSELLRDLGMHDDENYIYLDKDGKAQKRVEATVHWQPVSSKRILVTCNSNDSLKYLRFRIGEVMEKYSTFSGLTSLQADSIYNKQQELPEKGYIGDYVKSGDHLTCNICSLDIWLDVKIEAEAVGLVIFFEIKVYKIKQISALKKSILDIANQIFKSRSLSTFYEESDSEITKIQLVYVDNMLTTETRSVLDQNELRSESLQKINEENTVEQVFDYLDRYVHVRLSKKRNEEYKDSILSMPDCTLSESLMQIATTMPVRNLRVEPKVLRGHQHKANFSSPARENRYSDKQNCSCFIL